jgi:hypothetical protein
MKSKKDVLFLKKKNQKNFAPLRAGEAPSPSQRTNQSFFASFCSQKEVLTSFFLRNANGFA